MCMHVLKEMNELFFVLLDARWVRIVIKCKIALQLHIKWLPMAEQVFA